MGTTLKHWIVNVIDTFKPDSLKVPLLLSLVQFHTLVCNSDMSGRADCDSINTVRNGVEAIEKQDGGTDLWSGLASVTDSVCPMLREDSHKTLITITDGSPSDEENVRALAEARAEFNQMLAVGV